LDTFGVRYHWGFNLDLAFSILASGRELPWRVARIAQQNDPHNPHSRMRVKPFHPFQSDLHTQLRKCGHTNQKLAPMSYDPWEVEQSHYHSSDSSSRPVFLVSSQVVLAPFQLGLQSLEVHVDLDVKRSYGESRALGH
jgi:hypothetical protein